MNLADVYEYQNCKFRQKSYFDNFSQYIFKHILPFMIWLPVDKTNNLLCLKKYYFFFHNNKLLNKKLLKNIGQTFYKSFCHTVRSYISPRCTVFCNIFLDYNKYVELIRNISLIKGLQFH